MAILPFSTARDIGPPRQRFPLDQPDIMRYEDSFRKNSEGNELHLHNFITEKNNTYPFIFGHFWGVPNLHGKAESHDGNLQIPNPWKSLGIKEILTRGKFVGKKSRCSAIFTCQDISRDLSHTPPGPFACAIAFHFCETFTKPCQRGGSKRDATRPKSMLKDEFTRFKVQKKF